MRKLQRPSRPTAGPLVLGKKGFTIIEVMIALAVAGLILLIVFEAIPTLERNSRNNQRKQDVNVILQAVSHYELNNSADFPPNRTVLAPLNGLSLYDFSKVSFHPLTPSSSVVRKGPNPNTNTVNVFNYQLCDSDGGTSSSQGAGYTDDVALYALETDGQPTSECQQL